MKTDIDHPAVREAIVAVFESAGFVLSETRSHENRLLFEKEYQDFMESHEFDVFGEVTDLLHGKEFKPSVAMECCLNRSESYTNAFATMKDLFARLKEIRA